MAEVDRDKIIKELSTNLIVKRSNIVYQHMRDPALLRYYYSIKTQAVTDRLDMAGSSPTEIFVGRWGYPKVFIGPMVPPEFGDTSLLGTPERWKYISIEDIVRFRSKLVRGMYTTNVHDVEKGRIEERMRDLALAEKPADVELEFLKKPAARVNFFDEVQPFGPSASIKSLDMGNVRSDKQLEKKYSDTDATATTAMIELYKNNLLVSQIQRALSAGTLGIGTKRKFVPTRWSITAVDDTLSKHNREEVKVFEPVDVIYAYYDEALDNRWLILFMPGNWQYESIEAWWPGTVWNEGGKEISMIGSYEGYKGRSKYAEMGGCYYSGRLAVTEKLQIMQKQAKILILREVHEGYIMPVGVWNVREHVRQTLEKEPAIMHTKTELFSYIESKLDIKRKDWIKNSRILSDMIKQQSINDYLRAK
jgi:hypothetical protein